MKRLNLAVAVLLVGAAFMSCDDSASASGSDRGVVAKVDTVYVRDTIRVADTLNVRDTLSIRDTLNVRDTLNLRDTLNVHDTLNLVDTLVRSDTVYKDNCTVTNNEDGSVELTCGDSTQTFYTALCGGRTYDASTQACDNGEIVDMCGDKPYDKTKQICDLSKAIVYDILIDPRDGKRYRTITIGGQTWMAENLNYAGARSYCAGALHMDTVSTGNCDAYGRLYSWSSALLLDAKYDSLAARSLIQDVHQGVCPQGWHLPNRKEWHDLYTAVMEANSTEPFDIQMRSDSLWNYTYSSLSDPVFAEPGKNTSGFNVLPMGRLVVYEGGKHKNTGGSNDAYFICTEEDVRTYSTESTSYHYMAFYNQKMNANTYSLPAGNTASNKSLYASVRCLKDDPEDE